MPTLPSDPLPEASARGPWHPSPLVRASVALHVGAAALAMVRPHWWPWALGAVLADHGLLATAGLVPRSGLLGPNWTHLPAPSRAARAVAITIDDGPDPEVTPRVLDLLEQHGARATFFCIGERIERLPQLAREIVARHHEIGNHSYRHPVRFSLLGPRGLDREIGRTQQATAPQPVRAHASSAHRPVCATRFSSRCWRVPSCAWSAGHAAASTPSREPRARARAAH